LRRRRQMWMPSMSTCCSRGLRLWPFMGAKVRVVPALAWTCYHGSPLPFSSHSLTPAWLACQYSQNSYHGSESFCLTFPRPGGTDQGHRGIPGGQEGCPSSHRCGF
jgi:hypothetical protein